MTLMKWQAYARKQGGTLYVALPPSYVKAHEIGRDDLLYFELKADGSLSVSKDDPEVSHEP